jgi:hypothetical protein
MGDQALHGGLGEAARRRQPLKADPDLTIGGAKPKQSEVEYVGARSPVVTDQIDHERIEYISIDAECWYRV